MKLPAELGAPQTERRSLRERVGPTRADELVESPELSERLRGIDRLAVSDSEEAVQRLVEAMAAGSAVRVHGKTRLIAVRALAAHVRNPDVRSALVSVLSSARAGTAERPLEALARETAAVALARAGDRKSLAPLLGAIRAGGREGETARRAVLSHPPRRVRALVGNSKWLSPAVMELFGEIGDVRAIGVLRKQLKSKKLRHRLLAAVALARLGDGTVEGRARRWLGAPASSPVARVAAVEVLLWLGAPGAAEGVGRLLAKSETRARGLELALRAPARALVPALSTIAEKTASSAERQRAITAMVRAGGPQAVDALVGLLSRPAVATQAAFGLASSSGAEATAGLERALRGARPGPAQRLVWRAAVVRYLKHDDVVPGLTAQLARALVSKQPADRAVAAFGLVLLGERPPAELVASRDEAVAVAAARASLARGSGQLRRCAAVLGKADRASVRRRGGSEKRPSLRAVACGSALLGPGAAGLSASTLASWAEQGGAVAPLAAMELAGRDSESYRARVQRMLVGSDPVVRAHVASGLARSREPDSAARLAGAYRFEEDPAVRSAIVRALSLRTEPVRRRTLRLARDLDPDARVRVLARSALAGRRLVGAFGPLGHEVLWLTLQPNGAAVGTGGAPRAARVVRGDGLCVPVVADPDGVLLVPGLSRLGQVSVQLAAPGPSGDGGDR